MGLNDLIALITSPPFFISVFGPTIINANYWIFRGKLSKVITRSNSSSEDASDKPDETYRKMLLDFLNKNDFETVFSHSVQLMMLFSASVFFAVDIFIRCWNHDFIKKRIEFLWENDSYFQLLSCSIIGYHLALIFTLFNGALATEKIIISYDLEERLKKEKTRSKFLNGILKIIPPLNTVTFFRAFLFFLIISYNYWIHHHG